MEKTWANKIDKVIIIFLPILIGIAGNIICNKCGKQLLIVDKEKGIDLLKTVLDIWGILLGFIFTATSILLTIGENQYVKLLKDTNHFPNILFSYVIAGTYLLVAITFGIVLLFVDIWGECIFNIFLCLNIIIIVSMAMCVKFLFNIILNMDRKR